MRRLLPGALFIAAVCLAQNAPVDPAYPRPSVDPTKEVKEPEPPAAPAPERAGKKSAAKERKPEKKSKK